MLTYPQPSVKLTNGTATWLHFDHLGSVRALTDAAGAKVESAIYRPFGEQSEWLQPGTPAPETKGWIGERYDADAGLQYLNARYYDPELSLFLQPDWFEVTKPGVGTNRFSYSFNDPVNKNDPGGNDVDDPPEMKSTDPKEYNEAILAEHIRVRKATKARISIMVGDMLSGAVSSLVIDRKIPNPFGHAAAVISQDGETTVYSEGTGTKIGSPANDYIKSQVAKRDNTVYQIEANQYAVERYIDSITTARSQRGEVGKVDNCSKRVADGLDAAGLPIAEKLLDSKSALSILGGAYDPHVTVSDSGLITPNDIARALSMMDDVTIIHIPRNGNYDIGW